MLSRRDKVFYHQIHPRKLAVDITGGAVSTWLSWQHQLVLGLVVGWVPSVAVTLAMVRWMDFARQRDSSFGRYVACHMTPVAVVVRLAGQLVMWVGAWFHVAWTIPVGFAVIVLGWTYSLPSWRARGREAPGRG